MKNNGKCKRIFNSKKQHDPRYAKFGFLEKYRTGKATPGSSRKQHKLFRRRETMKNVMGKRINALFKQFPRNELMTTLCQSVNSQLYQNYLEVMNEIATAKALNDEELFRIATTKYEIVYQKFIDENLNSRVNESKQVEKEAKDIRSRILSKEHKLKQLDNTISELEKNILKIEQQKENIKQLFLNIPDIMKSKIICGILLNHFLDCFIC